MPYLTILTLGISAGIAGNAGITHLLIGTSRRPCDRIELLFALLSLSVAAHTLAVLALHTATTVATYVLVHKYIIGPTSFSSLMTLMWFVALYSGVRPRRFLLAMSLWFALILVLHLSLPFGIMYAEVSGLHPITLPWGDQIVIGRGMPNPLGLNVHLFNLAMFAFFCYALARQYRSGNRRLALALGMALALLLAARVADSLLLLGLIDWLLTSEFAFVGIVIAMSLALSYGVTQTETELHTYQLHLQDLVAARTAELTRANEQLSQEIHERTQLDIALQRRVEQLTALKQIGDISIRVHDLTAALQGMCAITTSLFTACSTYIIIPPDTAMDPHVLVGYDHAAGPLGVIPLDVALTDMPLTHQVLTHGRSLIVPSLQAHLLPPGIREVISRQQLHSSMFIPLAIRNTVIGVMVVATDQAARTFSSDDVSLAETIAWDISAAIDATRIHQRTLAAHKRLSVLYQAAQAISRSSLNPEQIYAEIHHATVRLMPAEAFVIILIDETRQEADDVYLADTNGRWPGSRYPLANTFADYMLRRDGTVRIDDFSAFPQSEFAFEMFGNQPDTESGVAVLLRGSERVLGVLFVQSYVKSAYTDEDEEALQLLAAHVAIALENARRYQQARELAASEERKRLARELHDSVTQTLYAASLLTEALPVVWRRSAAEGAQNLAELRQLVRGALAEMRTLLFELRPAALLSAELGTLLKQLGDVLTGHTSIPVELSIAGATEAPAEIKIALYRIAQEAFNNIARHAGATRVGVTFRAEDGALFLVVRDNGRGFDLAAVPADHMGLRIMAERAGAIGARLRIDSAPRRGTEVSVSWPEV